MNKSIILFLLIALLATTTQSRRICRRTCHSTLVKFYRYWQAHTKNHFYTANVAEIGTTKVGHTGRHGYKSEGFVGYISTRQIAHTQPLYRYFNPRITDHFYTTNYNELRRGRHGWRYEGIAGYVRKSGTSSTRPLYRYWNHGAGDHFYTQNFGELGRGRHGWRFERVEGNVWKAKCKHTCKVVSARAGCLKIWEHFNFHGKAVQPCTTATYHKFFKRNGWNDKASSVCAGKGNDWLLYQHAGKHGMRLLVKAGTCKNVPPSFNDQLSHAQKLPAKRRRKLEKWGKCTIWGDPHYITQYGRYDAQALGDTKAAESREFKVHIRTTRWTPGTSVINGVAVLAKNCDTKIVYYGAGRLYVNGDKVTPKEANDECDCATIKYHAARRLLSIKRGGEIVNIINSRVHNRRWARYYQDVHLVGHLKRTGACAGRGHGAHTAKGIFPTKRRRRRYKIVRGKCLLKHKNAAVRFCHRQFKGLWKRRKCVFDRCQGMTQNSIRALRKLLKSMKYWVRYWKNKENHHNKEAAKYLALYNKQRKNYLYHVGQSALHRRMRDRFSRSSAAHKAAMDRELKLYNASKKKASQHLAKMRRYQKKQRSHAASRAKFQARKLAAKKAVASYSRKLTQHILDSRKRIKKYGKDTAKNYRKREKK